jgi:outer membrane protein W
MSARMRGALALLSLAAWASASAQPQPQASASAPPEPDAAGSGWLEGLRIRAGGLYVKPTGRGQEVELSNVSGYARLAGVRDGPIAGSSTSLGGSGMFAAIVGYAPPFLDRQLSIETILALPFEQKLYAGGTLASTSLAPKAIGTLPTGVPALGRELGTVTVLPPVVTAVYRFFPRSWIRPYLGAGGCVLLVLDAQITNPVLASVRPPKVEVPPAFGWVAQVGSELRFGIGVLPGRSFFLTADVKYIGGLEVTARVKDIWVSLPGLPVYGAAQVGDNTVHMKIDPLVTFLGVGVDL